jgi:hypothetical protein
MKVHSGSTSSLPSVGSGPASRRNSVRSPLRISGSDDENLTQRCESAMSLPQKLKRPAAESKSSPFFTYLSFISNFPTFSSFMVIQ